jgi:type I restriction enzyme S subunit
MIKGWEIKPLKDIAAFSQGIQVGLEKHETKQKEGYVRFIRIIDYTQNTEDIRYIPNPGEKYYVNEDDIVMVRYGSPGLVGRGKAGVIANNLFKITILRNDITNDYLTHFLSQDNIQKYLSSQGASTMPALNFGQLGKIEISFPKDINQQDEIVSILDDAFESIELAKSNAEKNLKNAKELFESYLNAVFESKDKEWVIEPFEKVCNLVGGSQPSKDDFIYEPKNGYIRLIQVRDYRTSKFITYIPKEKARRFCSKNDIMIGRYGPPIFGIFKGLEGAYNVALMKAEVNNKLCDSEYFYWFLKTNKLRQFVEKSSKRAAGQDGIRKELLDKYPVPFPRSIEKQKSIVRKIEMLTIETKRLESLYQQKLNDLEELKKSILQKAFNGELKTSKKSS